MEDKDSNLENVTSYKKFGLPSWMVNNIERLNFVTDFEQYACSPPETEGFLAENIDNCDLQDNSAPMAVKNEPAVDKPKLPSENKGISESKSAPNLLANAAEKVASLSVVESIKHEEFYSSPDTTPCATPEPSPAPRRRMSGQQDTVRTNPGRWFYLGNFKKADPNSKEQNVGNNKENKVKHLDKPSDAQTKRKESPIKQSKNGIKLVISNFDLNAISPSSW